MGNAVRRNPAIKQERTSFGSIIYKAQTSGCALLYCWRSPFGPAIAHWHGFISFTSVHFHALKAINLSASCQEKAIFALKKLLAKGG